MKQEYENFLKIGVHMLSNATSAEDLSKILRVSAYLER